MRQKFHVSAHLHIHRKLLRYILGKSFSYLYEVVRTNVYAYFWTFRNFWLQLPEKRGAIWRRNEKYVALLTEQYIVKVLKTASKSTRKPSHNSCLNCVPHAQADQAWHTKNTNFRS